jgi:hypothetical protein
MDEHLAQLRARILRGEYNIDPRAVADAILEHAQSSECSNPESDPSASMNEHPGEPATIWPIQVSPAPLAQLSAAASAAARAFGGMQAQSS